MSRRHIFDFDTAAFRRFPPIKLHPSPPAPPASVAVEPRSSVAQHGITFTFDQAYTTGQFLNGDWWAIPAAPGGTVTVTAMSPAFDPATTDHGWQVNPASMTENSYGGGCPGSKTALTDALALPVVLSKDSSLVKTIAAPDPNSTSATGHTPALTTAVVLTVLDTQPAADAFRPPYYGATKRLFTLAGVVQANLPSLAPPAGVAVPDLATITARFQRVQLDHFHQWPSRYMHPADNFRATPGTGSIGNYGSDMAKAHNDAILRLMLNDATWAQKQNALIRVLQAGIDWYGIAKAGGKWYADGGHMVGRKQMILFAAIMLNDADMKTVVGNTAWDAFSENGHVYAAPSRALYGRPEPVAGDYWKRIETGSGKRDLKDPTEQIDGGDSPGYAYQNNVTGGYCEAALIARLLPGGTTVWNHAAFLEYVDRWHVHGVWTQPDTETARRPNFWDRHGLKETETYRSVFCEAMWDLHRGVI